ncbi:MAG: MnhB domain-containing protein [Candidatus Omnitrophota bacterium]
MIDTAPHRGMTIIVKTITRLTVGLLLVYGIAIVLRGRTSPGGGFAGGVIIALSFVYMMLAFGKDMVLRMVNKPKCLFLMSAGAMVFLCVSVLGFMRQRRPPFFEWCADALESVPVGEVAVALMVGMGLFIIFWVLASVTEEKKRGAS